MKHLLTTMTFALFFGLASCTPGPEDLCDSRCDCEGCSAREYDECVDDWYDDEEKAADRRCLPEFDDYHECRDSTWVCRGDDWETDCRPERDRLRRCLD